MITPRLKGYGGLIAYADDFVVGFQYKSDAKWFYERLKHRMGHFGLSLEEEKSRLIEFLNMIDNSYSLVRARIYVSVCHIYIIHFLR